MKSVFAFLGVAAFAAIAACSSNDAPATDPNAPDPPVTQCDPNVCAPGNTCLALDGDLKCRKACTSNTDAAGACPSGYTCVGANESAERPADCVLITPGAANKSVCAALSTASGTRLTAYACPNAAPTHGCVSTGDGSANYCCNDAPQTQLAAPLCQKQFNPPAAPNPAKQWGATCLPTDGIENNPACDKAGGFACFALAPTDAAAYCTRYNCTSDRECAPGFGCEIVNVAPNAERASPTAHLVQSVCLRRAYGSSCTADLDCPDIAGRKAHCAPDINGMGYCTPECDTSTGCNFDAKCVDPGVGVKVCYPRADVIVGNGDFCSPCRNDADCGTDGLCTGGGYTQEKFCAKPSSTPCTSSKNTCPAPVTKPGEGVGCHVPVANKPDLLDNYCLGVYSFGGGDSQDLGCYTPNR